MNRVRLQLPLFDRNADVKFTDPIRFYYWPVLGRLYRRRVEMCLQELTGGERILEVGFGSGVTFENLRGQYRELHGIDLEANVEEVSRFWLQRGLETKLRSGDVLDLPYSANMFDSVLLVSILEHLQPDQQAKAFKEIQRVLKPGGQVIYGVPIERPLMTAAFRVLGYDVRELHGSTELDVRTAAAAILKEKRIRRLKAAMGLSGAIYEVGHFIKA